MSQTLCTARLSALLTCKDTYNQLLFKIIHNYTQDRTTTVSQPKRKEALGVGIWWWWPSIVVSSIIFVRPPIIGIIISWISAISEVTRCDIGWRITTAAAATAITRIISVTRRSRRISVIITEKPYVQFHAK